MAEDDGASGKIQDLEQLQQSPSLYSSQSLTEQSKGRLMFVTTDSPPHECSIFPPVNHEGLFIASQKNQDQFSSPPPRMASLWKTDGKGVDPPPCVSRIYLAGDRAGWLRLGLELLRSKVLGVGSAIRHYAVSRRAVWSFSAAAGVVTAVLFWFLCARARRRRLRRQGLRGKSVDYLITLIKERDEKILQLLHQISQMNEALLACRRSLCGGVTRGDGPTR